jgi:hypothetical protein
MIVTTPGYNIRLTVEFATDRHGRRYAQYHSVAAMRNIRVGVADAEAWIAQGLADEGQRGPSPAHRDGTEAFVDNTRPCPHPFREVLVSMAGAAPTASWRCFTCLHVEAA